METDPFTKISLIRAADRYGLGPDMYCIVLLTTAYVKQFKDVVGSCGSRSLPNLADPFHTVKVSGYMATDLLKMGPITPGDFILNN